MTKLATQQNVRDLTYQGWRVISEGAMGVTMVKPKRISVPWMLLTGVFPYLLYNALLKRERSMFLPAADLPREGGA